MIIFNCDMARDGGTILVSTSSGDFYIDKRIGTVTEKAIFTDYPDKENATMLQGDDLEITKNALRKGIESHIMSIAKETFRLNCVLENLK